MKTLLGFISALIVAIVGTYYAYYLNSEKADVRYTLTAPIPTKLLSEKAGEKIQQLEIQNIGNTEAKEIRVLITANIVSYDLLKYSKAHSTKEFKSKDSLEVLYPTLPPKGNFKLLIRSDGGVSNWNLDITHSKGKAEEIFAKSALPGILAIVAVAIWVFILLSTLIMSTIGSSIDSLERKARWSPQEILRRSKPFYITDKGRWFSIRKDAIEAYIDKSYSPITKSEAYSLLSIDKPDYLNDEEWISIKNKAVKWLSNKFTEESLQAHTSSRTVLQLLAISKPVHYPDTEWNKLKDETSRIYLLVFRKELDLFGRQSLVAAIKMNKPKEIQDHLWDEHTKYIKNEYYRILWHSLKSEISPLNFLEKQELDILNPDEQFKLRQQAYSLQRNFLPDVQSLSGAEKFIKLEKPTWVEVKDYESLLTQAQKTISLDSKTQRYESLLYLLESILFNRPLKDKPSSITDEEWAKLNDMDTEIRKQRAENSLTKEELAKDKEATAYLKDKIIKQLHIIDHIFKDPKCVDKVEEYENVFAPGNWDNLKKLASELGRLLS